MPEQIARLLRLLSRLVTLVGLMPSLTLASTPAPPGLAQAATAAPPSHVSTDALASALRPLLLQFLPGTLYESSPGWGNTSRVPNGLKWPGHGLRRHPEVQYDLKNDGTWRKVKLTADNPATSLRFSLSDLKVNDADRLTFTVVVWLDVRVHFEQQKWESGVRLYSTSAQARFRVKLTLQCEATLRLELTDALLPDLVCQLRIAGSKVAYDHLVVEHLAGIGGTGARWLGEVVRGTVHELRPSIERNLLARANSAILKAGASREVRLGVGALLKAKGKA
jgi:hypothetical protein